MDLSDLPVVDGHCHPLLADPWAVPLETFLDLFSEGRPGTMTAHVLHTGVFQRAVRGLARRLASEPSAQAILERRRLAGLEAARTALAESRIAALLVDTGYPPDALPLVEMRRLLPCAVHEVFRVETCAERLVPKALPYETFLDAFRSELRAAAGRAVAFKSIIAYRSGLAVAPWPPADAARSYREVLDRLDAGGAPRLTEKPLLDTLFTMTVEAARETDRPLQIHAGFGDPDIDLPRANPVLLRPVLEDARWAGVRFVILHLGYPYWREAAFMTAVWPQAYLDLSLALPFLGPAAAPVLTEVLSLAPTSKLLYGSDLRGLPELFALSADWARDTLAEALGPLIARGALAEADGHAIARAILADNATAVYGLPPEPEA